LYAQKLLNLFFVKIYFVIQPTLHPRVQVHRTYPFDDMISPFDRSTKCAVWECMMQHFSFHYFLWTIQF